MKKHYLLAKLFVALFLPYLSQAQLTITYPSDRIVLQRSNLNQATLTIAGYVTTCRDRIEARLVPIKSNASGPVLGTPSPAGGQWQVIVSSQVCENFRGELVATGGWYRLEVRAVKNGSPVESAQVSHVGIGEVFLVAGQSNSSGGDSNPSGPGASEDAVSSVNFQNVPVQPYNDLHLPCTEYVHLDQFTKTAPFGNYAWCWGSFGDKMVQKLGVPIMIFNSGWSSTGVWNWKESIDINSTTPSASAFGYNFPLGLPFGHLRKALNNYIAQSGIRAILWHQGESDNLVNRTRSDYYNDLKAVIDASRSLSGKTNLGWLVSRASRFSVNGQTRTWPNVIDAQNDIIGLNSPVDFVHHTFPGPETDPYYTAEYRSDEVHFVNNGLLFLAQLWADKIDNSFLNTSVPYPALPLPTVSVTKSSILSVKLNAAPGWSLYNWLNPNECSTPLSTSQVYETSPGPYRLQATDTFNNVVYSPLLFLGNNSLPVTLAYFRTMQNENSKSVRISWATSSETDASHFEVLHSTNGLVFSPIASLDANGNSVMETKYETLHADLPTGHHYYRLREVDLDGTEFLSQINHIHINQTSKTILYPNPVETTLTISSESTISELEVYNSSGTKIKSVPAEDNSVIVDFSRYMPGLYTIKVNGENYKIVKSR